MSTDNVTPIKSAAAARDPRSLTDEQMVSLQQAIAIIEVIQNSALNGAITTETSLPENALQRSLQVTLDLLYTVDPDLKEEPASEE